MYLLNPALLGHRKKIGIRELQSAFIQHERKREKKKYLSNTTELLKGYVYLEMGKWTAYFVGCMLAYLLCKHITLIRKVPFKREKIKENQTWGPKASIPLAMVLSAFKSRCLEFKKNTNFL